MYCKILSHQRYVLLSAPNGYQAQLHVHTHYWICPNSVCLNIDLSNLDTNRILSRCLELPAIRAQLSQLYGASYRAESNARCFDHNSVRI